MAEIIFPEAPSVKRGLRSFFWGVGSAIRETFKFGFIGEFVLPLIRRPPLSLGDTFPQGGRPPSKLGKWYVFALLTTKNTPIPIGFWTTRNTRHLPSPLGEGADQRMRREADEG